MDKAESYCRGETKPELREWTLGDVMDDIERRAPDRLAFVYDEPGQPPRSWTYREFNEVTRRVSGALLSEFDQGDHIAIWAPNCAEWVFLQHGAARAGMVLVTANPAYTERELTYVLKESDARALFHASSYRGTDMDAVARRASQNLAEGVRAISLVDWDEFVSRGAQGRPSSEEFSGPSAHDAMQIQFTSGTTGDPKGVLLHHYGVVNAGRFVADRAGFVDGDVSVNAMPLFHIGGCGVMELGTFAKAGTYVLAPGFDPEHVLELVARYEATITLAVPTMLVALLEVNGEGSYDLSSLRTVVSGGASVPVDLVRRVKEEFQCGFTITYGQTELCGVISQTGVSDTDEQQATTVGRPLPHAEIAVVDPDNGSILPVGDEGEVWMRGYQVMIGYYGDPQATADTIRDDGWLQSGDLGVMDRDGYLRITGRIRDVINRGGEKISPVEVEDVIYETGFVRDVAVVSVPDPKWGEVVGAVVRVEDEDVESVISDLEEVCQRELAAYKIPRRWFAVSDFPQTPSGKIQKFKLREAVIAGELDEIGEPR